MNSLLAEKNNRRLTRFFQVLLLMVFVAFAFFIGKSVSSGIRIESDLQKLFPQDPQHPLANHVNQQLFDTFGNNLILAVSAKDKATVLTAATLLDDAINQQPLFIRESLQSQLSHQQRQQQLLLEHRYHLLTPEQRENIRQKNDAVLYSDAARAILGFRNSSLSFIEDPFNFAPTNVMRLQLSIEGEIEDDRVILRSGKDYIALNLLKLNSASFSLKTQTEVDQWLQRLRQAVHEQFNQDAKIWVSGAVFHGAEASKNAQREMTIIGSGSILGILILFALAFRQFRPLLLTLISVAFGCSFSFFATLYFFGNVHLITLVFGASLIGVAVDYSLHYLCKQQASLQTYQYSKDVSARVRRFLLPALFLSLLTSVLGYSCLLQTPLIGLQQIACFSVLGLIGAWLWVVVFYPYLMPKAFKPASPVIDRAANYCWSLVGNLSRSHKKHLLIFALLFAAGSAFFFEFSRDVRTLYKPSVELFQSEQFLQQALKGVSPNQYFLLRAPSAEELLTLEARFIETQLQPLIAQDKLLGVMATSEWVPSIEQQTQDYNAQRTYLYQNAKVDDFFNQLGLESELSAEAEKLMLDAQHNWLTIDKWLSVARPDQALLWQGEFQHEYVSIIALRGVKDVAALMELQNDKIIFVDRIYDLSQLLVELVKSAAMMLALAYGVISLLILGIYRRVSALGIVLVPLLSSVMAIALLSTFGVAINLFHMFGCYLILGLGIDYAIFSYINGHRDFVARRAIWLAAMTSSLSFGLLALSQTPMVQSFGIVLAMGCLFNLLLAPVVSGLGNTEERVA